MSDRVGVLHTGGTIGMLPTFPDWDFVRLDPQRDSADMRPSDWMRIGRAIAERGRDYVGFVVLHGTDTMTYTASALSFLLDGELTA